MTTPGRPPELSVPPPTTAEPTWRDRDRLLSGMATATYHLLHSSHDHDSDAVPTALQALGEALCLDRIAICCDYPAYSPAHRPEYVEPDRTHASDVSGHLNGNAKGRANGNLNGNSNGNLNGIASGVDNDVHNGNQARTSSQADAVATDTIPNCAILHTPSHWGWIRQDSPSWREGEQSRETVFFPAQPGDWYERLHQGQTIQGQFDQFTAMERAELEAQQVRSLCLMPIHVDHQLWGWMRLDDCERDRTWSDGELAGLKTVVYALASFIQRQQLQAELHQSRRFSQIVMDNIPQFIFWKDEQSRYLGCNQRWATMAGLEHPAEVVGLTDYELPWTPEQRAWYLKCDRLVVSTGSPLLNVRQPQRQGDGDIRWRETSKIPLRDEQGTVIGILGVIQDVTEHEKMIAAVRHSEEQFRTLVANLPGLVYRCRCDRDRTLEFMSDAAESLSGYPVSDFIYSQVRTWSSLIHPQDQANMAARVEQAIQSQAPFILEYRILHQDGSIRWVHEEGRCSYDEAGQPVYIDGVIFNISDRKQAEASLQQLNDDLEAIIEERTAQLRQTIANLEATQTELLRSQQRLGLLVQQTPLAVIDWNLQAEVIGWNPAAADIFGYTAAEALGCNASFIINPELTDRVRQIFADLMAQQGGTRSTNTNLTKAGEEIICEWYNTPLVNADQEVIGMTSVVLDVTEPKRIEAELRRSQQKMDLLVQHTPLAVIEWTPDARVVTWNPAAETIFGYTAAEALNQHTSFLCTEDVKPYVDEICRELIAGRGGTRSTNTNVTQSGEEIICEWYNTPLIAADGEVIGLSSLVLDVSDRVAAENELRQSQAMLRLVIDTIPQQIFWKDRNCVYLGCNQKRADIAGLSSPAEIIGKTDWDLPWSSAETEFYLESDRRIMANGQPEYHIIESQCQADGRTKWHDTSKVPLHDANGNVVGILGTVEDITERREFEAALAEREQRFRTLVNNLPGVVYRCLHDEAGTIQFVSDAVENLLGYPAAALINSPDLRLRDFAAADDAAQIHAQITAALDARQPYVLEYAMHRADGTTRWVYEKGQGVFNETGQILWLDGVIFDISDRKAAEKALEASEAQYRTLVETANSIIVRWDKTGKITFMNEYGYRFFGYEPGELTGRPVAGTLVPSVETSGRNLELLIQDIFQHPDRYAYNENENIRKDGSRMWIAWANRPILDNDGNLVELLSIGNDITERKLMEEALRESEQRFRDVSEAAGEYLWELDVRGVYTFLSDRVRDVKGYAPADLLGQSPFRFMPDRDAAQLQEAFAQASMRCRSFTLDHRAITPTGEQVWERVTGVPLLDEAGAVLGFRGTGLSITQQKEAEIKLRESEAQLRQQAEELAQTIQELQRTQSQLIQSEKMSSLGQLVAGVAHEINNPVSFIYGNLSYASDYIHDLMEMLQLYQRHYPQPADEISTKAETVDLDFLIEDLPRLLESMKVGANRIKQIVLSLRTFSRMDEAERKAVNLHDGIDSTLMILQNRLRARSHYPEIQVIRNYGNLPLVDCYAGPLNQVFMNILGNAIDALEDAIQQRLEADRVDNHADGTASTDSFTPQIHIHTALTSDQQVSIRIADNGIGIPEQVKSRLFDPFFTTKPIGKGTGMGLSISYQIVTERHGGSLTCESVPNQGTEFHILIPLSS